MGRFQWIMYATYTPWLTSILNDQRNNKNSQCVRSVFNIVANPYNHALWQRFYDIILIEFCTELYNYYVICICIVFILYTRGIKIFPQNEFRCPRIEIFDGKFMGQRKEISGTKNFEIICKLVLWKNMRAMELILWTFWPVRKWFLWKICWVEIFSK